MENTESFIFKKEFWSGDSRDGKFLNGEGYHYFKMSDDGRILEAFEVYEADSGEEKVSVVPEMINVHWINDLGFHDFDTLDELEESEFDRIREISSTL
jgi:hypothetical protein